MSARPRITLDCIIFGLQRFGGISNYWAKLIDHVCGDVELEGNIILPRRLTFGEFNNAWLECLSTRREVLDARIARYFAASAIGRDQVFHTSYYRTPRQRTEKYIVSVYDFTYERYGAGLARIVHSKQKITSIMRADAVLCISESTRRDVLEFCPKVDPSKLHVIELGVDVEMFYQEICDNAALEKTVLFVGRRGGYKRFDLAVEAVRESPRLSLGVVGPALTHEERRLLQRRLGVRWHEYGPVSNADLRKLYSSAFAFIFPSDYEGFGLPILEAMACGCPVVAAGLSSFPEVGGTAAYYAERQNGEAYADALRTLDSISIREEAIRRGMMRVGEFHWLQTFKKTKAVYMDR